MIAMRMLPPCVALLVLCATTVQSQKSAVLGIDLGSQYFKVAYVKTGGFDIVLNEASKRKTATALSMIKGERLFGDSAYSQKPRYPESVMIGMQHIIGKSFEAKAHEQGEFGAYHLPFAFKKDESRGTVIYDVEGAEYSPDELLGMLFHSIKDMSIKHIEQSVSECVITVPPYLTEHERRIIIDAAAMVDLSVIMLVNDNTAVAIRYGIDKKDLKPTVAHNVLFVDVGASHTTATVATYITKNITEYKKVPSVEILGVAWSKVGGTAMDAKLTEYFADVFDKKYNKKIRENRKAISKLRKDSEKIKTVLSANKETVLVIESLMDDIDFKCKINREEFEALCPEIFKEIEAPIKLAIERSGIKVEDIHEVLPFGAARRTPKVKEIVLKATNREIWQPFINDDETAALGAAFVAANFSKSFRLKEYHVYDYFPYSVGINMNGKKATIFKPGSVMEARKTISQPLKDEVKEKDELAVSLSYDDAKLLPEGTPLGLASYTINGMKAALEKYNVTGTPKISIAVGMHRDAIAEVLHAELKLHSMDWVTKQRFVKKNVTEEVAVKPNTTNSTNGSNETEGDETKEEVKEEKSAWSSLWGSSDDTEKNETNGTKKGPPVVMKNVTLEKTVEVTEEKLEKKLHTVALNLTRKHEGVPALSDEAFNASRVRHQAMVDVETDRTERANSKNDVEAFIFQSRQKLSEDGADLVSTEEEREKITAALSAGEDWLWEEGDDVEVKVYQDKKSELSGLVLAVLYRLEQHTQRPAAIKAYGGIVMDARKRAGEWQIREAKRNEKNETTWVHKNATDKVLKLCTEAETFITEKEEELKTTGLFVKPPFSVTELAQYIRPLANEVSYLRYKPKPKAKKVKKKKTNKSNDTNSTNSNLSSKDDTEVVKKAGQEKKDSEAKEESATKTDATEPVDDTESEEAPSNKDMPTDEL